MVSQNTVGTHFTNTIKTHKNFT